MARILTLNSDKEGILKEVAASLENDNIIIYPTDTIYGMGCNARSQSAIEKIYSVKQRSDSLPLSVMMPSVQSIRDICSHHEVIDIILNTFFPGALTLILPIMTEVFPSELYSDEKYVGFRIPDHPFSSGISKYFKKGIITTSVNISSQPSMTGIDLMRKTFLNDVDLYIKDPILESAGNQKGSTIVKIFENGKLLLLREGYIPFKNIWASVQ